MDLARLFGKKHAVHVDRCNTAINLALQSAKNRGFTHVLIPDVGGWIHYEPACKKLGFTYEFFETKDGFFDESMIPKKKAIILFHSLAGYHTKINTKSLRSFADANDLFLIEDACGVVGLETNGHIVVCSFGRWKPIDAGFGGCIAADFIDDFWLAARVAPHQTLSQKIEELPKRREMLYMLRDKVRLQLQENGLIGIGDSHAIVLIVSDETEQSKLFCDERKLEYTDIPRYIRSKKKGISIELKRFTLTQLSDQ